MKIVNKITSKIKKFLKIYSERLGDLFLYITIVAFTLFVILLIFDFFSFFFLKTWAVCTVISIYFGFIYEDFKNE